MVGLTLFIDRGHIFTEMSVGSVRSSLLFVLETVKLINIHMGWDFL